MAEIHNDLEQNPQITYPTLWEYVVIGRDEEAVQGAIFEVLEVPYEISRIRQSSGGKFVSVHICLEVDSKQQRDSIFSTLSHHPSVKMVI